MELEYVLVPAGLLLLAGYHGWLVYTIRRNPKCTVIGINAESRRQWVHCLMAVELQKVGISRQHLLRWGIIGHNLLVSRDRGMDPLKNGTVAIQALRNNMMAATQLATIAITLSSLITALVSKLSASSVSFESFAGSTVTYTFSRISSKYFAVLVCFLLAFFCNVQAIRHYAHVSFLMSLPSSQGRAESIEFVARHLNQGSLYWSLGIRAFCLAFPLLLWIFGCIVMFICCVLMTFVLFFLDITTRATEGNLNILLDDTKSKFPASRVKIGVESSRSRESSVTYRVMETSSR